MVKYLTIYPGIRTSRGGSYLIEEKGAYVRKNEWYYHSVL